MKCQFLLSLHLSDNGITKMDYFEEILTLFKIKQNDLNAVGRLPKDKEQTLVPVF